MNNNKTGSTTAANAVCAIIFISFTFYYLYAFQGDILGMIQYSWSNHETHYDRLTGSLIFTAIATLLSFLVSMVVRLPRRISSLVYLPSLVLIGLLTSVDVDESGVVTLPMSWSIFTIAVLVAYPFVVRMFGDYIPFVAPLRSKGFLSQVWWSNMLTLFLMMLLVYGMGNTDRTLHTRLAVERLSEEGRYEDALRCGIAQYDHGDGLTMWRAYALSRLPMKENADATMLGERLFTYNIDGVDNILPHFNDGAPSLLRDCYPIWQSIGFVPRNMEEAPEKYLKRELRRGTARKAAKDYLLCDYLLRKDLQGFADVLPRYYDGSKVLPKHYAEALTICRYSNSKSNVSGCDSIALDASLIADYKDFLNTMREKKSSKERYADLRDNYFGTYWYYYYATK